MNILFIATESVPYCKTGGVADAVHGLGRELRAQLHDVRIVIPRYRDALVPREMQKVVNELTVPLGAYSRKASVWKCFDGTPTYLIQNDYYFERTEHYGYLDDYERFIFFTRAVLELLVHHDFKRQEENWFPDIIQGYDWATGLIPGWLPYYENQDSKFAGTRFVLSIYNPGMPGVFGRRALRVAQQEEFGIFEELGELADSINFLGRGILFADRVVTVNPNYGPQNPLPESARQLSSAIAARLQNDEAVGIQNGIDYGEYDTSTDSDLYYCFDEHSLQKRVQNKRELQKELRFECDDSCPLMGMVSRLIPVRGFELVSALKDTILNSGKVQFVVLAEPGVPSYMKMLNEMQNEANSQKSDKSPSMRVFYGFNEKLARRIYAGCDIFLMPSKEEPSAVQQFMAMRYGAIPVVHHTGVLRDTVIQYQRGKISSGNKISAGVGFSFTNFNAESFLDAVNAALNLYTKDKKTWYEMQRYNMRKDFSWFEPVHSFLEVYEKTLKDKRVGIKKGKVEQSNPQSQLLQAILEIDSLPGIAARDSSIMLQQAARIIREITGGDAVYVWMWDEMEDEMKGATESLAKHEFRQSPDKLFLSKLLNQRPSSVWTQPSASSLGSLCMPILGLRESEFAQNEGWVDGRSVLIAPRGQILGRIDVLFRSHIEAENNLWITNVLTTIANSLGFRLETIRLKLESDEILVSASELLNAHSFADTGRIVEERAKKLSRAKKIWLYLYKGSRLQSYNSMEKIEADSIVERLANEAATAKEVRYVVDCGVEFDENKASSPFRSLLAMPMVKDRKVKGEIIGVLVAAKTKPAAFSPDEEAELSYLATKAAGALQTALWRDERDQSRVGQIGKLAASLIGGLDFNQLLEQVVTTTAEVLQAQAASLYLINDDTKLLEIKAAAGYHKPLLKAKASYKIGEGTTGWIAQTGITFKADSLTELHTKTPYRGKHKELIDNWEPNAFLGVPLKIVDRTSGRDRVIGVLKLEDRLKTSPRPLSVFSDEDVRLGEMMANIIATVVYNTQLSENRLRELSTNLGKLSGALAGSQDMQTLMDNIVDTIAKVLNVDAATLYLADENNKRLVIQAAYGYQKPLVEAKAFYEWGEGVTGRIAQTNEPFWANELDVLRKKGGSDKGKYDDLQGGKRPTSFYGWPLKVQGRDKPIGVLKVESLVKRPFTNEDVLLIEMMGNVISTVVYNAQLSENRLRELSTNLVKLSGALAGSPDMQTLMDNIVDTIAEVLKVDAATLYLADENNKRLVIQAAYGYQKPLVAAKAFYEWGEGVTGRIAQTNQPFQANELDVLREKSGSQKGKYDDLQEDKRPTSFYGLPLRVQGRDKPIGVLKVESLVERPFTNEDVLLIEMMANVISTVVFNAQLSENRLRELSANLVKLSGALAGSQNMQTLMDNIVDTIAQVLQVDAATLYLADENNQRLAIQAAYGYQKPLVAAKAFYEWGEGVSGRIAQTNQPFGANELDILRKQGGSEKGKYDDLQGGKRPISFYGLPLRVQGRDKPIGVLKVESLVKRPFTNEDVLLIEMMGNVIATVVYNAQLDQARLGKIVKALGSVAKPRQKAAHQLLTEFARSSDRGTIELLAKALATAIGTDSERAYHEAIALWEAGATPELYTYVAEMAQPHHIQSRFNLFYQAARTDKIDLARLGEVYEISHLWLNLNERGENLENFQSAVIAFMQALEKACNAKAAKPNILGKWIGLVLDTTQTFENTYLPNKLPFAFHRNGYPYDEDLGDLRRLLTDQKHVVLPLWGDKGVIQRTKDMLRNKLQLPDAIDTVVLEAEQVQKMIGASRPDIELQHVILSQISLPRISPYNTVGPTPNRIFFGREKELNQISDGVQQTSFAVIGGRRVGKTSILFQLHHVRLPAAGFRTLYFDCSGTHTYDSFLAANIRDWRPEPPPDAPGTFGELLQSLPMETPLVLLLDEADKLVPNDRATGWPIFTALRVRAQSGHAQVVLSGEYTLLKALEGGSGPLHNFTIKLPIGRLEPRAVEELITRPMKQLDIELVGEKAIVDRIWAFTSGHPNVVQRLCSRLIERLNEQGTRRITLDDVNAVIEAPQFQEDDFLGTYLQAATSLEEIIVLLLSQEAKTYRFKEVQQLLYERAHIEPSATAIKDALDRLVDLRSILKHSQNGYAFAVEAFPLVLAKTTTVEDLLAVKVEKYNESEEQV